MKIILQLVFAFSLISMMSCKTKTVLTSRVELGMTKQEVVYRVGEPFNRMLSYDEDKNVEEVLIYKEKTFNHRFLPSGKIESNHLLVFKNHRLIAIEQGPENWVHYDHYDTHLFIPID